MYVKLVAKSPSPHSYKIEYFYIRETRGALPEYYHLRKYVCSQVRTFIRNAYHYNVISEKTHVQSTFYNFHEGYLMKYLFY